MEVQMEGEDGGGDGGGDGGTGGRKRYVHHNRRQAAQPARVLTHLAYAIICEPWQVERTTDQS
jgi:hypothetical protein